MGRAWKNVGFLTHLSLDSIVLTPYVNARRPALPQGWVFFRVNPRVELAVPQERVFRILHQADPEYPVYAAAALAPHERLGLPADPSRNGILALFASGACWAVEDASFGDARQKLTYLAVPQDLFGEARPWCRGVLRGEHRWAWVTDPESLEGALV